jgi:SPP1 gp7 family putative phage head morphogenesis protein
MNKTKTKPTMKGIPLRPNASIAADFTKPLLAAIEQMARETKRVLRAEFNAEPGFAQDASISSQSRIAISMLVGKWEPRFSRLAKRIVKRMIARTSRYSAVSVNASLKSMSPTLGIDMTSTNERLQDIIKASVEESVSLIKLIPSKYFSEVQGQVARSITTGDGLKSLVPFLNEKYGQNIRHARNVALDQTRKAYAAINVERMKAAGVTEFEWVHSGGSAHPRQEHIALDGKVFKFSDPPLIGRMYGKDVYGLPAQMISCRCIASPIINL